MRALVVYAHPSPDSLTHAACERATAALTAAGHDVTCLDLYAEQVDAAMSEAERRAYHTAGPILDPTVAHHAELVRRAEALVFVYPTWWMGPPAVLKGWLDRVLVPGVAFHLDPLTHRVVSELRGIRRVVGVTTYGSSWMSVRFATDGGRRTLLRALRMLCARDCRTAWLALHSAERVTPADRSRFLDRVERRLARL